MIVSAIKKRISTAMKDGDTVARDVLRLALGEIQTAEARSNAALPDEEAAAALRKLIKSNEETLAALGDDARASALRREIEVLEELLPARLTVEQIALALAPCADAIKSAKADGQAIGVAMKHLKSEGASFDGADVAQAVKKIRSST
jgi:uncharacterized protein